MAVPWEMSKGGVKFLILDHRKVIINPGLNYDWQHQLTTELDHTGEQYNLPLPTKLTASQKFPKAYKYVNGDQITLIYMQSANQSTTSSRHQKLPYDYGAC